MNVLKFGGSSVASAQSIARVFDIVQQKSEDSPGILVVVSAFGGITDLLIRTSDQAESNNPIYLNGLKEISDRSLSIAEELLSPDRFNVVKKTICENINSLENILSGVSLVQEASKKTRDYILSFGERNSAFIISQYFEDKGLSSEFIDARKYIKTDASHGSARVNFSVTNKNIIDKFTSYKRVALITGFIGSDLATGRTTTLGRGGSDFTAAIFAAAINAKELQIWTDVSGVLTSNPKMVSKAYTIKELTYSEAMEMSHFGAKVLYYPTIRPVKEKGIPTRIKNTFKPNDTGTIIHSKRSKSNQIISGLSSLSDISIVTIEGSGLQGVSGIANRLFKCLALGNVNVIMITQASSEYSISLAIKDNQANKSQKLIEEEFEYEIKRQLIEPIRLENNLSLLAIVGENMKNSPGVAGKLFSTLGKNGINIEAIAQGSSELNITFAVKKSLEVKALNSIHDAFFLSQHKTIHLFIIGVGLIGKTLLKQIESYKENIKQECGIEIVINGLSNSKKMIISDQNIETKQFQDLLTKSETKADPNQFINEMISLNYANSIFVDNTASDVVPGHYSKILKNSIPISTPNKIALSSSLNDYKEIKRLTQKHNTHFLFETNVGAGLPVISTLNNLLNSGDQIEKIEAVLSGSLSYIFNNYDSSLTFSALVKLAKDQGLTEPDPRDDLSGKDIMRKLLILGREAGYDLEESNINIKPIVSDKIMAAESIEAFFDALEKEDHYFKKLYKESNLEQKKLRIIATLENGVGSIALKAVGQDSPFYGLNGSDNMISFTSRRYNKTPLVIRGPGAGADVTAAGVLSEIINLGKLL
ncbi:MAG: bifunctional aspartate kinase/homoserine dehydrogenase I [Saprospiraceae bacterium]|nr:bifunctional aspartate kinase/homoserine dehydrogenase I [Bacteroidia bacterium]NNE13391.1 bifunctional aspartate kinase/homoserine dehydrogenase I [Saprospiraceae bacterium]NNL93001.1 bifunctional aspartate kinase/homoserine dehydrogenase I [Saprospiraceae bacterium]